MSTPIRIGAVGFGYWGPNVIRNVDSLQGAELVAICDANESNRARATAAYPAAMVVSDVSQLLALGVEAVVIATSAETHFEVARATIRAGVHTLVEKPLTLTSADAIELVRLADDVGVTLMVGHLMLYHAAIEWIRDYIDSGELGEIYYLYMQRLNLGRVRTEENAFWSLAPHDVSVAFTCSVSSQPVCRQAAPPTCTKVSRTRSSQISISTAVAWSTYMLRGSTRTRPGS
jgi:predicted dehydrogenase